MTEFFQVGTCVFILYASRQYHTEKLFLLPLLYFLLLGFPDESNEKKAPDIIRLPIERILYRSITLGRQQRVALLFRLRWINFTQSPALDFFIRRTIVFAIDTRFYSLFSDTSVKEKSNGFSKTRFRLVKTNGKRECEGALKQGRNMTSRVISQAIMLAPGATTARRRRSLI